MSDDMDFDLVVIGAGTGGNGVARMAAGAGMKTAIVDAEPYGGTCALRGCDPKKMLVAVSEGVEWSKRMAGKGLVTENQSVNWPDMIAFKRTFTDKMPQRVEGGLEKLGVTTLYGEARFVEPHLLEVDGKLMSARNFHIATGARPATLGIDGEEFLTTSTEFLELPEVPKRIVFVGGGFIAMEFSHIASRCGSGEVTVLQSRDRPLLQFDPDLVDLLVQSSTEMGIDIRCEARVEKIEQTSKGYIVTYAGPEGAQEITCDVVVHAAGRVPNIDTLNLEAVGVETTGRGIRVSEYMRSVSAPHVFAAGDCADSGPNLTPVSANEARIAGKNLVAGKDVRAIKYPPIPSVVFTLPPVAAVGLSEEEAHASGKEFDTKFQNTDGWYSSMRVGAKRSAFKVLIERGSGEILGAHLIGPGAEEQINLFSMAVATGLTANKLKALIFAYPSYASDMSSMV